MVSSSHQLFGWHLVLGHLVLGLFECYQETLAGDTTFLTEDVGCEGEENMGPVGLHLDHANPQLGGAIPLQRAMESR